jgi:hypothetical protein
MGFQTVANEVGTSKTRGLGLKSALIGWQKGYERFFPHFFF